MDIKTPVLADPAPIKKSRLSMHSSILPYSPQPQRTLFATGMLLSIPRKKTGVLDDVRTAAWLDSMKSSSPPPKKFAYDTNADQDSSDVDVSYRSWTVSKSLFHLISRSIVIYLMQYFEFLSFYSSIIHQHSHHSSKSHILPRARGLHCF